MKVFGRERSLHVCSCMDEIVLSLFFTPSLCFLSVVHINVPSANSAIVYPYLHNTLVISIYMLNSILHGLDLLGQKFDWWFPHSNGLLQELTFESLKTRIMYWRHCHYKNDDGKDCLKESHIFVRKKSKVKGFDRFQINKELGKNFSRLASTAINLNIRITKLFFWILFLLFQF